MTVFSGCGVRRRGSLRCGSRTVTLVIAVEKDPDRYNVARAKNYGLPVVIGRGGSHFLLKQLSLSRARAGRGDQSGGGEHLGRRGRAGHARRPACGPPRGAGRSDERDAFVVQHRRVRDVYRTGGTLLAAAALGSAATEAFLYDQTVYLITLNDWIEPLQGDVKP